MTDYILVPVEPTPEMVEAAEEAHMPFGDMELAIRLALLAAPDAQGEPSSRVVPSRDDLIQCLLATHGQSEGITADAILSMLTAAPQPAEQQPSAGDSLASVPDEAFAVEFAAWWDEHGQFCRAGGGTYEKSFAFEAWRHLYPQLMNLQMAAAEQQPEDSAAVRLDKQCREAVAAALGFIRGGDYAWSYLLQQIKDITSAAEAQQPTPDVAALVEALEQYADDHNWCYDTCDIGRDVAKKALAAHRKGGGDEQPVKAMA